MKSRVKEWIKRYVPAEVISFLITIAAILICNKFTSSRITIAVTGTWLGTIAYFGYILVYDIFITCKEIHQFGGKYTFVVFLKNIRAIVAEFGFAELLDSLLIRPALMYYLPILTGNMLGGSILAKFAADVTFYVPAIIGYELSKSRFRKFH